MMIKCKVRWSSRFKLIGCFTEKLAESIISNVNHAHKKEIEAISKKINEAESDSSRFWVTLEMPLKKKNSIKVAAVGSRVFTLKDLVAELNTLGINVSKTTKLPDGNIEGTF